jgi:membrane-associated HD superfamily phosphohydrolase
MPPTKTEEGKDLKNKDALFLMHMVYNLTTNGAKVSLIKIICSCSVEVVFLLPSQDLVQSLIERLMMPEPSLFSLFLIISCMSVRIANEVITVAVVHMLMILFRLLASSLDNYFCVGPGSDGYFSLVEGISSNDSY